MSHCLANGACSLHGCICACDRCIDANDHLRLVYCKICLKTHAVKKNEKPCAPGAWIDEP